MTLCLNGLAGLASRFDAFLVDQFGVLLDGTGAYPFVAGALARLASLGRTVLILSNSGKRSAPNEARLARLGIPRTAYRAVLSSGETAHGELARRIGVTIPSGTPVWTETRDDDTAALDGLDLSPVRSPGDARLIILAGCRPERHDLEAYGRMLRPAADAGVACLCTNPDMTMMTGDTLAFGTGRVARLYEEMGGRVEWIGKPYPLIYSEALRRLGDVDPARIVCVGDSPIHDVAGGRDAGLATALVRTGIHAGLSAEELMAHCAAIDAVPDFVLPKFAF